MKVSHYESDIHESAARAAHESAARAAYESAARAARAASHWKCYV